MQRSRRLLSRGRLSHPARVNGALPDLTINASEELHACTSGPHMTADAPVCSSVDHACISFAGRRLIMQLCSLLAQRYEYRSSNSAKRCHFSSQISPSPDYLEGVHSGWPYSQWLELISADPVDLRRHCSLQPSRQGIS